MRLCLNTSTIKPLPLLEKIRLTGEAGFEGVELWINDVHELVGRGGEVRDVERALQDQGLFVPCAIALRGWAEADGEEYPLALEEARRRMELGRRLGAACVVATPSRAPAPVDRVTERYADLLRIGREAGIRPALEFISFFGSVHRLDQAWGIVRATGEPDACLILDTFHVWNSGSRLEDLRSIPADRIAHYHFDDAAPDKAAGLQTDPDRVMPGDGAIDLEAHVRVLRDELGYDRTASLELFNRELWSRDPREVLRVGLERMRAYLG